MISELLQDQASLYVLGALPPDEHREFESRLGADPELGALVRQ
jgi:anti-sigma factor RsiW